MNLPGMDVLAQFLSGGLNKDDKTRHLNSASGTAGTGANKHKHHQNCAGYNGPLVKVCSGKACGGDNGPYLESRFPDGSAKGSVKSPNIPAD